MGKKHCDKCNVHILQCQANFYHKLAKNLDINNQKNSQVFSINFPINAILKFHNDLESHVFVTMILHKKDF